MSWWIDAPRDGFTAYARAHLTREPLPRAVHDLVETIDRDWRVRLHNQQMSGYHDHSDHKLAYSK